MRRLVQKSVKKYPGDFRLMAWFVYAWNNVDPEKCIEIGEYVLKNCTQDEWRMFAKRNLYLFIKGDDVIGIILWIKGDISWNPQPLQDHASELGISLVPEHASWADTFEL